MILTDVAQSDLKLFVHFVKQNSCQFAGLNNFFLIMIIFPFFFFRIDADGHQNQWRPSSSPTNTIHEDRTPFRFLPLTALFLLCPMCWFQVPNFAPS